MNIKGCSLDANYTNYEEVKKRYVVAQGWMQSKDVSFFATENNIENYIDLIDGENSKKVAFTELTKQIKLKRYGNMEIIQNFRHYN